MTTEAEVQKESQWSRVREAIAERWPQINRDELAECPNDICSLTHFVKNHVGAHEDEIESVVTEFAPQGSIVGRVSQAVGDSWHQAAESARSATIRADECIAKRPTESVLTSFVAGIAIGATVTALWFRSRPEPSAWDRVKSRTWG